MQIPPFIQKAEKAASQRAERAILAPTAVPLLDLRKHLSLSPPRASENITPQ